MRKQSKKRAMFLIASITFAWLGLEYESALCGIVAIVLVFSVL